MVNEESKWLLPLQVHNLHPSCKNCKDVRETLRLVKHFVILNNADHNIILQTINSNRQTSCTQGAQKVNGLLINS